MTLSRISNLALAFVLRGAFACSLSLASAGCSLFSDLDRFEQEEPSPGGRDAGRDAGSDGGATEDAALDGGSDAAPDGGAGDAGVDLGCSNPRTLCVRLDQFSPHVDNLVQVDLVTAADNILRARAIVEPMNTILADFVLPLAVPAREVPEPGEDHPLMLKVWADREENREYDAPPADHSWNLDLPAEGTLVFVHNTDFNNIEPLPTGIGADFRMSFEDMAPHRGQLLEVMVIEVESGRAVGLYRIPELESDDFEIVIPDIIDPGGIVYRVEFYADFNRNGRYDMPPTDHTWVKDVESGANGVQTSFTHGTDFAALEYQFPFEP